MSLWSWCFADSFVWIYPSFLFPVSEKHFLNQIREQTAYTVFLLSLLWNKQVVRFVCLREQYSMTFITYRLHIIALDSNFPMHKLVHVVKWDKSTGTSSNHEIQAAVMKFMVGCKYKYLVSLHDPCPYWRRK